MKKYVCFEIPCAPDGTTRPEITLVVAEVTQLLTRRLQELGVDPVRAIFKAIPNDESL